MLAPSDFLVRDPGRAETTAMQQNRFWMTSMLGLLVACGGSEFSFDNDGGYTGAGGTSTSATSTTATTGTTGDTTGTTSAGGASTSTTTMTGGQGGATTGASGAGGKSGTGGQGGATTGGKGGASGSGGGGHAGASGSGGAGTGGSGMGGTGMGGTGMGGTGTGGGDAGRDASVDCAALRMDVDAKLPPAQKCDTTSPTPQCQDVVAGVCCSVPINSKSSPEGMAYLAALDRYTAARCRTICPLIACRTGTPTCLASAGSGAGQCVLSAILPPQ